MFVLHSKGFNDGPEEWSVCGVYSTVDSAIKGIADFIDLYDNVRHDWYISEHDLDKRPCDAKRSFDFVRAPHLKLDQVDAMNGETFDISPITDQMKCRTVIISTGKKLIWIGPTDRYQDANIKLKPGTYEVRRLATKEKPFIEVPDAFDHHELALISKETLIV